jgi:hypothetical protein
MAETNGTTNINSLDSPLTNLNTSLSTQGSVLDATLTKQTEVIQILDREQARLNDRKVAIDAANVGQKRMVDLTRNAAQRNRAINNMFITVVVALLLYLGIRFSSNLLPELVHDILMILLVSIALLTLVTQYNDYIRRDNMDYDMINLGEPAQMIGKTSSSSKAGDPASGLISSRIGGGCIEDACCPSGSKYNKKFAICVPINAPYNAVPAGQNGINFKYFIADKSWKNESTCGAEKYSLIDLSCNAPTPAKQPFTTISGSQSTSSDKAKPNDPFEFSDYNLYK